LFVPAGIGLVLGPIALVMALVDLVSMREGQMDRAGESRTQIGLVLGALGSLVNILVVWYVFRGFWGFS
jgi:hypothetical protein